MADELILDARVRTIPVTLELDNEELKLELFTFSGEVRDEFMDQMLKLSQKDHSGKVIGMKKAKGLYSMLLCKCLRYRETEELVGAKTIDGWPSATSKALYDNAQELNGLKEDKKSDSEDEDSGN